MGFQLFSAMGRMGGWGQADIKLGLDIPKDIMI